MSKKLVVTTLACNWRTPVLEDNGRAYDFCTATVSFQVGTGKWADPVGEDSNNVNARRALRDELDGWFRSDEVDYCPEHSAIVRMNDLIPRTVMTKAMGVKACG